MKDNADAEAVKKLEFLNDLEDKLEIKKVELDKKEIRIREG